MTLKKAFTLLLIAPALTLSMAGCWESDAENAAEDVGEKIEDTADKAGDAIEDGAEKVEDAAEEATESPE